MEIPDGYVGRGRVQGSAWQSPEQIAAAKEFQSDFENLKRGGSDEMKRESRRNNKRNMTYNKADELNELGQKVIVQFN